MTDLPAPAGTFTFLFTDIEGSTQLWEQAPEAMKVALARHDTIMRQVIEAHHGHIFKTMGDAFYAAFASAPQAVSAAFEAQKALHTESWGEIVIKVRMGLHTGAVETRDNDYFGLALNRVARLMSAGHGGQVLLSTATAEMVRPSLPADAELRDMGERRLKDLARPEHIYQLLIPDLPVDFPPLKTLDAFHTNLPAQLTSFIGREKEIAAIKQLVISNRLTTLTGPGGTGKTRLSLQVASNLLDSFPEGVWFVELAPLTDPTLIPQTAMATLGLHEDGEHPPLDVLSSYLQTKKALLILDNCEHLIEASAQLTEALLHACTNLHVITSSREALGIAGEVPFRVPSLSTPDVHYVPSVETLAQYEAVRLFIDRAKTVLPSFTLTDANTFAVAQICARLDGIPLAIELAAARVKLLKVEQVAERLDDRFRLLTGGSRTALPRQQTLRAMIDWSYDLLPEPERVLLRRLSVFASGWSLEAAEAVTSDQFYPTGTMSVSSGQLLKTDHWLLITDVFDLLAQLVNKSLVVVDADIVLAGYEVPETRYRLLETVRQYAREKLFETGEGTAIRDLHLQYFVGLAERAEPEMVGPRIAEWVKRLEPDLDNFRAALEWSLEQDALSGLRLVSALSEFWDEAGLVDVPHSWLPQLIHRPEAQARTKVRARALISLAQFTKLSLEQTKTVLDEALSIYQELGDQFGIALSLHTIGELTDQDAVKAQALFHESLTIYKALGNKVGMAWALNDLSDAQRSLKDDHQSRAYLDECLKLCREIGYIRMMTYILYQLGQLAFWRGEIAAARAWLDESMALQNQLGRSGTANAILVTLGHLTFRQGDYTQAAAYYQEGLARAETSLYPNDWALVGLGYVAMRQGNIARAREIFNQSQQNFKNGIVSQQVIGVVYTLEGMASMAVLQGQHPAAAQLFAWTDSTRQGLGYPRPPVEQADVDRDLASIRAHLDEAAFAKAQAAGRAMSMDEAIALALESIHD